jgi:hypothetical protein
MGTSDRKNGVVTEVGKSSSLSCWGVPSAAKSSSSSSSSSSGWTWPNAATKSWAIVSTPSTSWQAAMRLPIDDMMPSWSVTRPAAPASTPRACCCRCSCPLMLFLLSSSTTIAALLLFGSDRFFVDSGERYCWCMSDGGVCGESGSDKDMDLPNFLAFGLRPGFFLLEFVLPFLCRLVPALRFAGVNVAPLLFVNDNGCCCCI